MADKLANDEKLISILFMKFNAIWGHKWTSGLQDNESFLIALSEWKEGLRGIKSESMKLAISHCRNMLEWPPSIAEFRKLCLRADGFPSLDEIMQQGIRRNFHHPVVKIIFNKIERAFKEDSEADLRRKISACLEDIEIKKEIDIKLMEYQSHGSETTRNRTSGVDL